MIYLFLTWFLFETFCASLRQEFKKRVLFILSVKRRFLRFLEIFFCFGGKMSVGFRFDTKDEELITILNSKVDGTEHRRLNHCVVNDCEV